MGFPQVPVGVGPLYKAHFKFLWTSGVMVAGSPYLDIVRFGTTFWPSQLQNFAATWDMYRVRRAQVQFIPQFNVNTPGAVSTDEQLPNLAFVCNYDDVTPPASFANTVCQFGSKTVRFDRAHSTAKFTPAVLVSVNAQGGNANGLVLFAPWLNTSGNQAVLIGVKYAIEAVPYVPGNGRFDVFVSLDVDFCQQAF